MSTKDEASRLLHAHTPETKSDRLLTPINKQIAILNQGVSHFHAFERLENELCLDRILL